MSMTVRLVGLERVARKLSLPYYAGALKRFFDDATSTLERGAKQRAPVNVGQLRASLTSEVDGGAPPLWGRMGTDVFYAPYVEYGTGLLSDGPGSHGRYYPPPAALENWAAKHGLTGRQVAYGIWKRGGTKPKRFMRDTWKEALPRISAFLGRLGGDVKARWEGF